MNATIYLIDDDPQVLKALCRLLATQALATVTCATGAGFLAVHDAARPGCAVIDLGLPDMDGLDLFERLQAQGGRPVIFLTGQGTIPAAVTAMRNGAIDFLTKPVGAEALLSAIGRALACDAELRAQNADNQALLARLACLTPREREVMNEVVLGRLNKQIADHLGAAEKTIKIHRGRMMRKLGVRSVADLVKLVAGVR